MLVSRCSKIDVDAPASRGPDGLIHTDSGDGGNDLAKLELIQNRCLSCGIQTNHQNSHLLLSPELVEEFGECKTHDCGLGIWVGVGVCVEGGWIRFWRRSTVSRVR